MKSATKYLFIDTNIYIQCCLLELEGDSLDTLNELEKLLEKNKVKLLLPEVVELEFRKVLENKFSELKKKIGLYKTSISNDKTLDEKIREDLVLNLDNCIKERERNTEKVEKKMEELFKNNKFTIRKDLSIKDNHLVGAYKAFLSGEKPFKSGLGIMQPDCVIIEALAEYFSNIENYKLFFCSFNKEDFAKNPKAKNSLKIHEDIEKRFKHIKYYRNLFELLNAEFDGKYTKESIEKLEEKKVSLYDDASVYSFGITDNSKLFKSGNLLIDDNPYLISSASGLLTNSEDPHGLRRRFNKSLILGSDENYDILSRMPDRYCHICSTSYERKNFEIDNGICDQCQKTIFPH